MDRAEKTRVITSQTMVPIGLLGIALSSLLGGAVWLTNLHFVSTANAEKLASLETKLEDSGLADKLGDMDGRLSKIEGQLVIMYEFLKKERGR